MDGPVVDLKMDQSVHDVFVQILIHGVLAVDAMFIAGKKARYFKIKCRICETAFSRSPSEPSPAQYILPPRSCFYLPPCLSKKFILSFEAFLDDQETKLYIFLVQ